jgi:hypothetical protein
LPIHPTPIIQVPLSFANLILVQIRSVEAQMNHPTKSSICPAFKTCLPPTCLSILPLMFYYPLPTWLTVQTRPAYAQINLRTKYIHHLVAQFQEAAFSLPTQSATHLPIHSTPLIQVPLCFANLVNSCANRGPKESSNRAYPASGFTFSTSTIPLSWNPFTGRCKGI